MVCELPYDLVQSLNAWLPDDAPFAAQFDRNALVSSVSCRFAGAAGLLRFWRLFESLVENKRQQDDPVNSFLHNFAGFCDRYESPTPAREGLSERVASPGEKPSDRVRRLQRLLRRLDRRGLLVRAAFSAGGGVPPRNADARPAGGEQPAVVPTRVLFVAAGLRETPATSMEADLAWSSRLVRLVVTRGLLAHEKLFAATLGAAYHAMTRDKLRAENAEKARQFAARQVVIARALGDRVLLRRAKIYLGYYHIFKKNFREGRRLLLKQKRKCLAAGEHEVARMAVAALVRLDKEAAITAQQLQGTQSQT